MSKLETKERKLNAFLQKEHRPYGKLFDVHSDAIYLLDYAGRFVEYNHGFSNLTGYGPEELIGKTFLTIIYPDDRTKLTRNFKESLNGAPKRRELRFVHKNGSVKVISTDAVPFHSDDGEALGLFVIGKDITKQKELEAAFNKQSKKFRSLIQNLNDVIIVIDKTGNIAYRSPSFENILGYNPDELSTNPFALMHPDDQKPIKKALDKLFKTSAETITVEFRLRHKRGHWLDFQAVGTNRLDDPDIKGVIINYRDISAIKKAEQEIKHMAYHDFLTELPNRRLLEEKLEWELKRSAQNDTKLAVMFIDLDNFKYINDTLGHETGDLILKKAANILKSCMTENNMVARWAGDEFIILAPDMKDLQAVRDVAEMIKQSFEKPIVVENYEVFLTPSIGISIFPESGRDMKSLIKNADLAMYLTKGSGKNDYKIFTPTMDEKTFRTFSLNNDLHKALINNQFELYYQPKINSKTKQIVGAEALIRWNHPKWGMVSPNEFIFLAEESGLIVSIGEWVLRMICRQIKLWEKAGFEPLTISLNFSAKQFLQKNLAETIASILKEADVDGKWLEIEITESMILEKDVDIIHILESIKNLGIQIALDDFGTGYSSLSYLRKYKFSTIKLDKSFVDDIHTNEESAAIIKFITDLGKQLKMNIVAEGVELNEQFAVLQQLGCHEAQGYLFSKPKPVNEFEKMLTNRTISPKAAGGRNS